MPLSEPRSSVTVGVMIAPGLEEVEALAVVDCLYRAGISTRLVSVTDSLTVTSSHGIVLTCEQLLSEIDDDALDSLDLIFLPGGIPGTPNLGGTERLMAALERRMRAGAPVAAICAAPSLLAQRGLAEGRRMTGHPSVMEVLEQAGAHTSEEPVVQDGLLFTSRGMGTAIDLGLALVGHFLGEEAAHEVRRATVYMR